MIKFFRKIRQKLLAENKFSKYFFYAIGEIILVVIGILIALQINNWNENRKITEKESVYLERIKADLISDSIYFTRRIGESIECVKGGEFFTLETYKNQHSFKDFSKLVHTLCWNSEQFVVQKSTYDELKFSGQLDIISNRQLKDNILNHYLKYEAIGSHIKELNEFSVREMSKIISIHFKVKNLTEVIKERNFDLEMEWQFINDPLSKKFIELETAVAIYRDKHRIFTTYFEESLNRIQLLVKQIDDEQKSTK